VLIEFRVENYRSIRDEQVLTMEVGRNGPDDDSRPRLITGFNRKLLPVAALYGANASGKSNVLAAMSFMREAVLDSHRLWPPEGGIPRTPFAWGDKRNEPSTFEMEMVIGGSRYRYGFVADDHEFLEEWLYVWKSERRSMWFTRDGSRFKFGSNLKGENKIIKDVTRTNALFLSSAAQHRHPQLISIYEWMLHAVTVNLARVVPSNMKSMSDALLRYSLANEAGIPINGLMFYKNRPNSIPLIQLFKLFLRTADPGIRDVRIVNTFGTLSVYSDEGYHYEIKHEINAGEAWLPLDQESKGTQTLFRLGMPLLEALRGGRLVIVDELESSLHPNLAEYIVHQFNDPNINNENAQLIFSTHDTNLLGTLSGQPALRRDQIWLTEKDPSGGTKLYPLTDFKPRNDENIERGYVQGRYGAVPVLADLPCDEEP
jgi:hypothetical protein